MEQAHALKIHEARNAAYEEFKDFLERINALLDAQRGE